MFATPRSIAPRWRRLSRAATATVASAAMIAFAVLNGSAAEAMKPNNNPQICYNAYIQNVGWQGDRCNGVVGGVPGSGHGIEAIQFWTISVGGLCAGGYWTGGGVRHTRQCSIADYQRVTVGTPGSGHELTALGFSFSNQGNASEWGGRVSRVTGGWQPWIWGAGITIGDVSQTMPMDGFQLEVS